MANGGPSANPLVAQIQQNGSVLGGIGLAVGSFGQILVAATMVDPNPKLLQVCLGLQGLGTALMLIDARWHAKRGTDVAASAAAAATVERAVIARNVGVPSAPPPTDPAIQRAAAKIADNPQSAPEIVAAAAKVANGRKGT
jgi:hypothetical protein